MLIQQASNPQLQAQAQELRAREAASKQLLAAELELSAHIKTAWERNRDHKRRHMESRLLACLRARKGEYDPDVLAEIQKTGGSQIYMMLTATKCRAAMSWIRDIVLPAGDRAWGLESTPVPEVPKAFMARIEQAVVAQVRQEVFQELAQQQQQQQQQQQAPQPPGPQGGADETSQAEQASPPQAQAGQTSLEEGQAANVLSPQAIREEIAKRIEGKRAEIKQAAQERADDAADKMSERVADELEEGGYYEAMEGFIDDFTTFPFAILKGPVKRKRATLKWGAGWTPVQGFEIRNEVERLSPFDIYPSPDAVAISDGDLCEHVRFSRADLHDAIGVEGWNEKQLRAVLDEYGRGGLRLWLWSETERAELEGRDTWERDSDRIDGVHFWGRAPGWQLIEWGMSGIKDPLAEHEIDAVLIGRYVVRAVINDDPLFRRPYQKASFQSEPGSWAGIALPELMADIQRMCNATARALANNMAIASGPLVEVFADRVADGENITDLYPWRIFQTKSDPAGGGNNRAIQFYQPSINSAALLQVFEWCERKADDATNIPRYAYGNERVGGAGQTASGLAMLMESASKGIRAAISHIDQNVIRPLVRKLYYENMVYNPDRAIKGDLKVVARGAAALVAKDSAQGRRMEALQIISNPLGMQVVGLDGYAELLREIFRGADMPEHIIPSREEIASRLAEQGAQPSPDEMKAQNETMKLQLTAAEQDRRFGLDVAKHKLDIEDIRHDNALDDRQFRADLAVKTREVANAASQPRGAQGARNA